MQTQTQWIYELHKAAGEGNQEIVWLSIRRLAECEISLLDFGDTFYLKDDFAADIASYLVFTRGFVQHWATKAPNQIWVYIKKIVNKFVWENCQKHYSIRQTLICQSTLTGTSGLRFTTTRLRTLTRTGQLFLLYRLFDEVPKSDDVQSLIRYLVSTMYTVIKSSPAYVLLGAYLSLSKILQKEERRQLREEG